MVYFLVALLARAVLRAKPAVALNVSRASGIAMIGIGVLLIVERLRP